MEIDRKMLEKAAQLPKEELASLIYTVVTAAGGSKMQARAAAANTDKLKNKLYSMTDGELAKMLDGVDPETLQTVAGVLKGKGGGNGG